MAEVKRVIWIVLDSVGIGELPDADQIWWCRKQYALQYGKSSRRFKNSEYGSVRYRKYCGHYRHWKMWTAKGLLRTAGEISNGKDTTIGHWEDRKLFAGPFPVIRTAFRRKWLEPFIKETGVSGILGNIPASEQRLLNSWVRNISAPENPSSIHRAILFFRLRHMKMWFRLSGCMSCVIRQDGFLPENTRWQESLQDRLSVKTACIQERRTAVIFS